MTRQLPATPVTSVSLLQRIIGWVLLAPGEAVRQAARLDKKTLAWSALALAALLTLSANLVFSTLFRNVKADMTAERIYTISSGTRQVLARIDEPISLRLYYTRKLGEVAPLFGKHFERVKALLEQYRDLSGGKIQLTVVEPVAFSDAEDRAVASGLRGVRISQDGETGYFGLAASNTTDNEAAIEFFAPDRERFLEYDLTKLIHGLANPRKRVVGLISGLPIDGGMNPMAPMRQPSQPWVVMEQIREFFEVRTLGQDIKEVPAGIDVLMLVQPTGLTKDAVYAIDQFAIRGGRVLAFVDPVAETAGPGAMGMPAMPPGEDVLGLLKAWGVALDTSKVAGDPTMARRVQFGGGMMRSRPVVTDYLVWLQIDKDRINARDPLAAGIERMHLASAGALTKIEGATTTLQPIIETSERAGLIAADQLRLAPDPLAIARDFKPEGGRRALAVRVSGETRSAFPDGRPKPPAEEKPADDAAGPDGAKGGEAKDGKAPMTPIPSPAEKAAKEAREAAAAKAAKEAKDAADAVPHFASGHVNVIVVADADLLHDQFWVDMREFLGQRIAQPNAHNAAFVVNALENLSGGEALAGLRGRGVSDRPFEKVAAIRRDAERRFREKEQALNAKLKDLQGKLQQMETRTEGGQILVSDKDRQTIEGFRSEMIGVRRELRRVQADLRRDIDRLDSWLRFFNIAAIPLLLGVGGIAVGLFRRRRTAGQGMLHRTG